MCAVIKHLLVLWEPDAKEDSGGDKDAEKTLLALVDSWSSRQHEKVKQRS